MAREENILAFGPFPADGFFGAGTYKQFDAVLAMYHDQGLVPFKALTTEGGVNYTAGLPVVRTSPAHGTAYEIAGRNEASPDSFREAIYMACDIFRNRQQYKEMSSNPLNPVDLSEA
jgi:4-hydroxythreonine-4-phosphate dehydrogenase